MGKHRAIDDPESAETGRPGPADIESDQDTEGHSLLAGELARQSARDHAREADRIQRNAALSRQVKGPQRSLRNRLLGR